jgi:hypothetical protein
MQSTWAVAAAVLVMNLPFGYWRAGEKRLTLPWVAAIHAPVPLVIGLRIASGMGWQLATFPVMVGAFFTGQFLGGRARLWWRERT